MNIMPKLLIKITAVLTLLLFGFVPGYAYEANEELNCDTSELNSDTSAQFAAQWSPVSWTVQASSSLPVVSTPSDQTCYYDQPCAAFARPSLTNANSDDYYFVNWNVSCSKNGSSCTPTTNTVVANGSLANITDVDGATITLTAHWETCTPCNTTNAECSVSVVNNVCEYTTSCLDGYGNIQNGNTSQASCSGNTITLNWNNGGHGGSAPSQPASCTYGATFVMPSAPSETNWSFGGWSLNGQVYAPGATVQCNYTTLNAYQGSVTITGTWTQMAATCAPGEYLPGGTTVCSPCNAGEYCPSSQQTYSLSGQDQGNTACAKGSYTNTTGATACEPCQNGSTTSAVGQTSCNAVCVNSAHAQTWETATWSNNTVSNLCAITGCVTGYEITSENGQGLYTNICTAKTVALSYVDTVDNSSIETTPTSCTYNTTFNLPDAPIKQGYRFVGWELVE